MESYRIYGTSPGNSTADLKYDRGIILEKSFKTGTTLVGQVLNGCGLGEADEGYLFDKDKYKNFMGRIMQSIGSNISIGVFGYSGKELLPDPTWPNPDIVNDLSMYGPDVSLNFSDMFVLNMQYLWRKDSQVYSNTGDYLSDIGTQGGFAELIFSPAGDRSKWYLTGLVNLVNSDLDDLDYSSATLHAGYLIRRNVRLVTEFTQVMEPVSFGKVSAGFVSAF
ncbi:MAG: hypothetical protein IPN68_00580 [Bacteroidetes bacterium]|nr:hypothetical protein [Bacteroidota bacterium]